MSDLYQGQSADIVLNAGDSVRVSTVGQVTVKGVYGAPTNTTTLNANTQVFGPYQVPAKLTVTAVSGTANYAQPTQVPVTVDPSTNAVSPAGAVSGAGFPRSATYIPGGDSRPANGNQDGGVSNVVDASRGPHNHLQTLMAGRLVQLRNAAVSGSNSSDMLKNLQANVLAYSPGLFIYEGPVNDINNMLTIVPAPTAAATLALMQSNVKAMYAACRAAGTLFCTSTIAPWTNAAGGGGAWTAVQKGVQSRYNRWVKAWCQSLNIPCADVYASNTNPATGTWVTSASYDTSGHYSDYGAFLAGLAYYRALDPFIPKADFITSFVNDYDNLVYDGAGGWTVGAAFPSTWTPGGTNITGQVNSVVARTDKIANGSLLQMTGTASAQGANMIATRSISDYLGTPWIANSSAFGVGRRMLANDGNCYRVVTAGTTGATQPATWNSDIGATTTDNTVTWERVENFAVGDLVYSEVEVFVSNVSGGAGVAIQSIFQWFGGGGNLTVMNTNDQAAKCAEYPPGYYVLRSRPYQIAGANTTANVRAYLDNGVTATIQIGRVALRHFPTV